MPIMPVQVRLSAASPTSGCFGCRPPGNTDGGLAAALAIGSRKWQFLPVNRGRMMRASYGLGLVGLGAAAALASPWQAESQAWRYHADHVLGTSLDIAVMAEHPLAAARAID